MSTVITVVVDNISNEGIEGEWGLCIHVKYDDKRILVDTGQSDLFLTNLDKLRLSAKDVDYAVLSHAHYDHSNGMPAFFDSNKKAKFYIRDGAEENCYKRVFFMKYIGMPKKVLRNFAERIEKVSGDYELMPGAYLIPHKTEGLAEIGKREKMYRKVKCRWVPDDFSHEQSLVLDTAKGLVIINSCSHGGAANIINEVKATFPDKHVYGLMGGFHLFNKSDEEVRSLAAKIKETGVEFVCTGHCTKNHAYEILKEELGDIAVQMKVGYKIEL